MSSVEDLGLCRVCANPFGGSAMFRLFDEMDGPLALAEIFLQVSGIAAQAGDSKLPKSCCERCRNRLQEVEDLRSLCQESDRKLRKMVGIGVKEEEQDEELNGSIDAIPKVEMIELPESYSYWDDTENRLSSSDGDSDSDYAAKGSKVRKTRNSKRQQKTETNRSSKNLRRSTRENLAKQEDATDFSDKPEKETVTGDGTENQETDQSSDDFDGDDSDPDFQEEKPKSTEKKAKKASDKPKGERKKRSSEPKPKLPKEAKLFQCAWCGRFFKTNHNLKEHETTHSSEKPLKCHICPKEFARRDYYKRHIKMHETEGQFKCNECDKAFHCNKRLENHISVKHRGERPFQCTLCPKTYPSASSLYGHVQTFHEKKQPFKCDVCLRTFYSKYILDRHKMKHKGIKSSQCPHCDKKYESNNYLHQHIAERHPEKAGNISRCLYCGLGYTTDSHYRKHVAKKHPEHLAELDQVLKAKREALNIVK